MSVPRASISALGWLVVWFSPMAVWGQQTTRPVIDRSNTVTSLRIPIETPATSRLSGAPRPDHPLWPALELARRQLHYIVSEIRDYRCVLVKQERVDGTLLPYEFMEVKCRQRRPDKDGQQVPFSLYMKWLAPEKFRGREALFVENRDRGDVLVRKGGRRNDFLNLWLEPTGSLAMRDNRYPITEFGFENMLVRLLEVGDEELLYDDCEVKFFDDFKLDGRSCFGIEVRHPVYRDYFRFYVVRIFIDNELRVPVHFESYGWPTSSGGEPPLVERYRYRNVELNVDLRDRDFDRQNPAYGFRKD